MYDQTLRMYTDHRQQALAILLTWAPLLVARLVAFYFWDFWLLQRSSSTGGGGGLLKLCNLNERTHLQCLCSLPTPILASILPLWG